MPKNYRFEILSVLAAQEGKLVNIRPLINKIIWEESYSAGYIVIMLHAMYANDLLWFDETHLPKYTGNKYMLEKAAIPARIEPQGMLEFRALRLKFYDNLPEKQ